MGILQCMILTPRTVEILEIGMNPKEPLMVLLSKCKLRDWLFRRIIEENMDHMIIINVALMQSFIENSEILLNNRRSYKPENEVHKLLLTIPDYAKYNSIILHEDRFA